MACCPMTICPDVAVNTGKRLMDRCSPPAWSHGNQTLYEAPSADSEKCCVNCSGMNANFRSGDRPSVRGLPLSS